MMNDVKEYNEDTVFRQCMKVEVINFPRAATTASRVIDRGTEDLDHTSAKPA